MNVKQIVAFIVWTIITVALCFCTIALSVATKGDIPAWLVFYLGVMFVVVLGVWYYIFQALNK